MLPPACGRHLADKPSNSEFSTFPLPAVTDSAKGEPKHRPAVGFILISLTPTGIPVELQITDR